MKYYPDVEEYKVYYAQSLQKAGMYPEAGRAALQVTLPQYSSKVCKYGCIDAAI